MQEQESMVYVPPFEVSELAGVTFGGFAASRYLCADSNKLLYWGKTLPEAMILAADRGKGWHLITAFEWAAGAYLWKQAETLDDCAFDLHSNARQWNMGLFMHDDGHVDILANLDVTYLGSPYGRGTISGSGGATPTLTVDGVGINWLKAWAAGAFNGMSVYIAEAAGGIGAFYAITDTTAAAMVLTNGAAPGNGAATFVICKHISTDIGAGCTSGQKILTLRDADSDLKPFAIPATTDGSGAAAYGNDGYWFDKSTLRAALRGGGIHGAGSAGVSALALDGTPSGSYCGLGFRACKALKALESDVLEDCLL